MRLAVITQVYGRRDISEVCIKQLRDVLPSHAELHVWQDDPKEDCRWVSQYATLHKGSSRRGIDLLRAKQLLWAYAKGYDEIYLTDNDAIHDPGWYRKAVELYQLAPVVSLYNTSYHSGVVDGDVKWQPHVPGISVYFRAKELKKLQPACMKGLPRWDYTVPDKLGNRCVVPAQSLVEHLGANGLHNGGWFYDVAINPTPYLQGLQRGILSTRKNEIHRRVVAGCASTAIINQPRGLGDILFMEPIAAWLRDNGFKVKWMVDKQFLGLQRHTDYIEFVDAKDYPDSRKVLVDDDVLYLPMRWSDSLEDVPYRQCMKSKYAMLDLDWRDWTSAVWKRDPEKEQELVSLLGATGTFALVNRHFRSDVTGQVPIATSLREIELKALPGFTLIDWAGVIENATEILSVGTSLQYLVELVDTNAKLFMYPRKPDERDCSFYDYLFKKPWKQIL